MGGGQRTQTETVPHPLMTGTSSSNSFLERLVRERQLSTWLAVGVFVSMSWYLAVCPVACYLPLCIAVLGLGVCLVVLLSVVLSFAFRYLSVLLSFRLTCYMSVYLSVWLTV